MATPGPPWAPPPGPPRPLPLAQLRRGTRVSAGWPLTGWPGRGGPRCACAEGAVHSGACSSALGAHLATVPGVHVGPAALPLFSGFRNSKVEPRIQQQIRSIHCLFFSFLMKYRACTISCQFQVYWVSLEAQRVKNLPAMQETWVQPLGWEDSLEKGMATHSSILA